MSLRPAATSLAALLLIAAAPPPLPEAALRRHIEILASDAYQGRRPGTIGETQSIGYIVAEMQKAGLSPGAADGGWLQPVPVIERSAGAASLAFGALSLDSSDIAVLPREATLRITAAPLVFLGFGDGSGRSGPPVKGAIVVLLAGTPPAGRKIASVRERRAKLAGAGAAAVLVAIAAATPWVEIEGQYRERLAAADAVEPIAQGALSASAWARLVRSAGLDAPSRRRRRRPISPAPHSASHR